MKARTTGIAALAAGLALALAPAAALARAPRVITKTYRVALAGANEVPPVPPVTDMFGRSIPLVGHAVVRLQVTPKTGATKVCVRIVDWTDDGSVFKNYAIFKGAAGRTGAAVVPLFKHVVAWNGSTPGVCQLHTKASVVDTMIAKPQGYYFNIQTKRYPSGSLRGQLKV